MAASVLLLEASGEDSLEFRRQPVIPVADKDAVVDASRAQWRFGLLRVEKFSIGCGLAVHNEADVTMSGLDSLETREGPRKRGSFVAVIIVELVTRVI